MIRFETLIQRHHDALYRYLWHMLRDTPLDAADLSQETWLRAWRAYGRLRPNSDARAWLWRIATNCALNALKRRRPTFPLDDFPSLADGASWPEEQVLHAERLARLRARIGQLPPKQRAALILRQLQGHDYRFIATVLGCREDSARAHVSLAMRRLHREFREEDRHETGSDGA